MFCLLSVHSKFVLCKKGVVFEEQVKKGKISATRVTLGSQCKLTPNTAYKAWLGVSLWVELHFKPIFYNL